MISDRQRATLMVVDDTPANLLLLEDMLTRQGYRVLEFPRGSLALQAAARNPPDLILLDVMMPEMDGFEVCRRLKSDPLLREIPVIFISALDDLQSKVRAFAEGGVDYVTKPFQEEEVAARVSAHLRVLALQRQLRAQNDRLEELVAQRTAELTRANARLADLARVKDDLLRLIAREFRKGGNADAGAIPDAHLRDVLNAGGSAAADGSPGSARRIQELLKGACLIAGAHEPMPEGLDADLSVRMLLDELMERHPRLRIVMDCPQDGESAFVTAKPGLLHQALETMISLAHYFSRDPDVLRMSAHARDNFLILRVDLDALPLTAQHAEDFFKPELADAETACHQPLGLKPVVAHRLLTASGGGLKLVKGVGETGHLEAAIEVVRL